MFALLILLCALLSALTFRVRGGLTEGWAFTFRGKVRSAQLPGQMARCTWAIASGLTVFVASRDLGAAGAVAPLTFAATTLPLFDTIDMGRNQGSFARDFGMGTLHGLMMGACAALALGGFHFYAGPFPLWFVPLISGAAWGACYALTWLRADWPEVRALRLGKNGNPCEAAELLFGLQFGAALFMAAAGG